MKREYRLKSAIDFKRVRRQGQSFAHPLVVMLTLPNGGERTRIGVSAGRSVGNAVRRNRAKRRLREAIRPHLEALPPGWDIVLLARKRLPEAEFSEIQAALLTLLKRAGLLPEKPNDN